uniref:Uncharacterized protein n=1 Tax=Triticum urartu TaxID=4572 RepID=A0A8R7UR65_TRIUA
MDVTSVDPQHWQAFVFKLIWNNLKGFLDTKSSAKDGNVPRHHDEHQRRNNPFIYFLLPLLYCCCHKDLPGHGAIMMC